MNDRKDMIREYKERKKTAGVFQVKNNVNGKVLIGGSLNLEGVLNGMFLLVLGIAWPKLALSDQMSRIGFAILVFGTYTNWATTLLAAIWGAGSAMMPIAGGGMTGSNIQEYIIATGLISLTVAMIAGCAIVLWGLRASRK